MWLSISVCMEDVDGTPVEIYGVTWESEKHKVCALCWLGATLSLIAFFSVASITNV